VSAKPKELPPSERPTTLAHRLQFALLKAVVAWLAPMPIEKARRIGERIGLFAYFPLGIRKRVVTAQIAAAFPELDAAQVRTLAKKAFANLGRIAIETALVSPHGRAGILALFEESSDFALVEKRLAEGRGVIAFTGHVGSWEMAGAYLAVRGIPTDGIARRMNNRLFDTYLNEARAQVGMTVVYDHEGGTSGRAHRRPGGEEPRVDLCAVFWPSRQDAARPGRLCTAVRSADPLHLGAAAAEREVPPVRGGDRAGQHRRSRRGRGCDGGAIHGGVGANGAPLSRSVLLAPSPVEAAAA
jgi:hypothetical protein